MKRELFDPPAIVKSADVRAELAPKIRETYRRTQEDRKQLGEWLRQCKEECVRQREDWLAWLEKETGIPRRTASWYMSDENEGQDESDMGNIAHDAPGDSEIDDGEDAASPTFFEDGDDPEAVPVAAADEPVLVHEGERIGLPMAESAAEVRQRPPSGQYVTLDQWEGMKARERRVLLATAGDKKFNSQGDNKNIEWALWSWNPVTGCLHNCPYCYARDIATTGPTAHAFPNGFAPTLIPSRLKAPRNTPFPEEKAAEWMGHKNVFVCSMADLFGRWVPAEWIEAVLSEVRAAPQWNFLFLTKFPIRMAEFDFPENAWVGTTVDCQARVANAEKAFRKVKAGVKWLSCEPLIEPLQFKDIGAFQWLVLGGSSRSSQTPEWHPPLHWVTDLEAQAKAAGVYVYHKDNLYRRRRSYPGQPDLEAEQAPEALRYLLTDR